jgi:hypothetical protein
VAISSSTVSRSPASSALISFVSESSAGLDRHHRDQPGEVLAELKRRLFGGSAPAGPARRS